MDNNSPESFFRDMPPVTRAILVGTFGITLAFVLGVLNVRYLLLDWVLISKKFHIWRLFTDYLFVGPFSFSWVFHMYFFVTFSSKLETHPSFRLVGRGGFLFFICLQMFALDLLSLVFYPPTGKLREIILGNYFGKSFWGSFWESFWDFINPVYHSVSIQESHF